MVKQIYPRYSLFASTGLFPQLIIFKWLRIEMNIQNIYTKKVFRGQIYKSECFMWNGGRIDEFTFYCYCVLVLWEHWIISISSRLILLFDHFYLFCFVNVFVCLKHELIWHWVLCLYLYWNKGHIQKPKHH